jgi:hypothetical protein
MRWHRRYHRMSKHSGDLPQYVIRCNCLIVQQFVRLSVNYYSFLFDICQIMDN